MIVGRERYQLQCYYLPVPDVYVQTHVTNWLVRGPENLSALVCDIGWVWLQYQEVRCRTSTETCAVPLEKLQRRW